MGLPANRESARVLVDVFGERVRQVQVKGYTPAHDNQHKVGQIALGGAAHAVLAANSLAPTAALGHQAVALWPWNICELPSPPITHAQRRATLVKAAAMMVAEIERIDRLRDGEV